MSFVIIWTYQVKTSHAKEFEATYAADGRWAKLFAKSPGFVRTDLLRGEGGRYCTLDYWNSDSDFERFKDAFGADYADLDRQTEGWTESETRIGKFETTGGS